MAKHYIQSQKNNQDHIFHRVSPSSPPILYGALFGLNICLVHQMFVTKSPGSFAVGGIVYFMFGNAVNHMVFGSLGSGGAESLVSQVTMHSVPVFDGPHPSPPLFFTNGKFGPHPHFSAFGAVVTLGVASSWSCGSIFMGGLK